MFKRSFWTKCDECGQDIYMAYVLPPNEYQHRYLPFEDESLDCCHLDFCQRTKNKHKPKNEAKSKFNGQHHRGKMPPKYIPCAICGCNLNQKNYARHMKKVHNKIL